MNRVKHTPTPPPCTTATIIIFIYYVSYFMWWTGGDLLFSHPHTFTHTHIYIFKYLSLDITRDRRKEKIYSKQHNSHTIMFNLPTRKGLLQHCIRNIFQIHSGKYNTYTFLAKTNDFTQVEHNLCSNT